MGKLLAWFKSHLCRWTTITEYCHDCGIRQPLVWWAPNELWSEVMEEPLSGADGDNMPGIVCPECFDKRASDKGLLLRWHPTVEHRRDKPKFPTKFAEAVGKLRLSESAPPQE